MDIVMGDQGKKFHGQTLNWLTIEPHAASSANLSAWFEQETGASIQTTIVPYADITEAAIQNHSGAGKFDIVQYWYPMIGALVHQNMLLDITDWWDENSATIDPDDFIPVFRDTWCLAGGRRYGVPYDGDMHLLFYNKQIFARYNLNPPKTWDEYLVAARTITKAEKNLGIYGCGIMAADIPLILIGTFLNRLAGFGGNFFDAHGKPTINSPIALAALEHLLAEMPYALPSPTSVAFDEMLGPWLEGRIGMVEFWADLGKISDAASQSIAHKWGVTPLPKGPGPNGIVAAPLNAGWSLGVSSKSRQKELALDFLSYCTRQDIILRICISQGGPDPSRWSTYNTPAFRKCVTEELAQAATTAIQSAAVAWPTDPLWPQLQEIFHGNLFKAVSGVISARQALDDSQAAWLALL